MPPTSRRPRGRQAELLPRSKRAAIEITLNHRLVQITEEIGWTELEELVQAIRLSKLKNAAGRSRLDCHKKQCLAASVSSLGQQPNYRASPKSGSPPVESKGARGNPRRRSAEPAGNRDFDARTS
jgi:hypothetical protein